MSIEWRSEGLKNWRIVQFTKHASYTTLRLFEKVIISWTPFLTILISTKYPKWNHNIQYCVGGYVFVDSTIEQKTLNSTKAVTTASRIIFNNLLRVSQTLI